MDENLWLIVWRKKSTDFVSIHIVWNPAKGSPFLKCVVSIRALPVRVGWGVCVWRLARMVWGIFTPPLPVDGLGHFFFHICPFDRGGVGLKLFGQCPYRTNTFQKGASLTNPFQPPVPWSRGAPLCLLLVPFDPSCPQVCLKISQPMKNLLIQGFPRWREMLWQVRTWLEDILRASSLQDDTWHILSLNNHWYYGINPWLI